ncbi:hypothetical protein [Mycolicibacterium iranicum]|uniref:Integrase n=1 Tax=Mycolicibacterium iranicum TaxID=912594 RepID=A0ABT4HL55_MYCIR|nr:hypothetical protein [Mycolicibacterium iranicum]MCZ0730930.1 hypothetical protein [Mycolicibacterium iranicum]
MPQSVSADLPEGWSDDLPVIANEKRILRATEPIPAFSADVWSLTAMAPLRKRRTYNCNFGLVPAQFRPALKKAIWILINEGKPDHAVRRGGTRTKTWVGPDSVTNNLNAMRAFLNYVSTQTPEVRSLRGIVRDTMDAYMRHVEGQVGSVTAVMHYQGIRLLHDLTAGLDPNERLRPPSWADDTVFTSHDGSSDNATPLMPDGVLTPMLLWSTAFVEQFADDVLSALKAMDRYEPAAVTDIPLNASQAKQLALAWTQEHGNSLPWTDTGNPGIAVRYMCFLLNWDTYFLHGGFKPRLRQLTGMVVNDRPGCPVPTPVIGRVHGKIWQPDGLDYYRTIFHAIDLQSACLFLLGLDSASRPQELLNLELEVVNDDGTRQCITERVEAPDGQVRHLLYGRTFKGQDGVDGVQRSDGVVRPWAITEAGATAVSVLERLNGRHGRLFVTLGTAARGGPARSLTTASAIANLRKFVGRMRCLASDLGLPQQYFFPEDAEDFMTLSVLRRTSEVLTQQEVGGILAGAHQAGHRVHSPYETRVTEGYGGLAAQSKVGRRTSERTGQALAQLVVESRQGLIGGPAGDRARDLADLAAAELDLVDPANLMTPVLSKEWKRITKSVEQSVYEIPLAGGAHAYCIFHLPWSACTKEGEEPDVAGCKIVCPNKALTTDSIRGLRHRQQELRAAKHGATSEEVIRADHLISAYDQQIADSGLPLAASNTEGRERE